MPKDLPKEYTLLFNAISCIIEDIRSLQFWLMIKEDGAKQLCSHDSEEDAKRALNLLFVAVGSLIIRFQETQAFLMMVQQQAEDLYIGRME